ncbi:hypothetical protein ACG7TL_006010 [Trametes sanguinea]
MFLYGLLTIALAAIPSVLSQAIEYNAAHNVTPIIGTWSSGSKQVVTGVCYTSSACMRKR